MSQPLSEILKDPKILKQLEENPGSFRFRDGASLVITMQFWPPHTILLQKDIKAKLGTEAIPTTFPVFGPMSKVLEVLSSSLNFTYKQLRPLDGSWGSMAANGTWSGMVGQVVRKEADLGLGPFAITQKRFRAIDLTIPIQYDTLGILVGKGSPSIDPWGFVLPMTPVVWAVFFLALLVISISQILLENNAHISFWPKQLANALFFYIKPPLHQDLGEPVKKSWHKVLVASWIAVSAIISWSYGSTLMSLMALRHIPHPVQNLRELLDNSHYKIIFEPDTAYLTTIKNVPSGEIKELNDLSTSGRFVYLRTRDFPSYSYLIRNGDHVQIFDTVTAMGFMAQGFSESGRCDFYWAKQAFLPFMYGMIGQKYSPLTPAINARLSRLFEAGLYNYWLSNQVPNITACVNTPTKVTMKEAIGINNIWGVAVIWTAGILLAGAVFGLEILHAKLRANSAF